MHPLEPRKLTWASLLAYWTEFAQAALALPDDPPGRAWRAAIPAVIGLQAVTMALGELDDLPPDQRALGVDRARLLVDRHTRELRHAFASQSMPPLLEELLTDAQQAVTAAESRFAPPQSE